MFRDKSVTLHMSNFMRNADNFLFQFYLFIFYNFFISWTQGSYLNHSFSWVTLLSQLLNYFAGTTNMTLS